VVLAGLGIMGATDGGSGKRVVGAGTPLPTGELVVVGLGMGALDSSSGSITGQSP
jgi:hypothetical protein